MTFLSAFPISLPLTHHCFHPPKTLHAQDVSLIIPVKNNQQGLDALLASIIHLQNPSSIPGEVLVVDNNSCPPIKIAFHYLNHLPIRLLHCSKIGPASARNVGAQDATGCWLWFCDSDCRLTDQSLQGYRQALNGAIGYAGWIQSVRRGVIPTYYEDQQILIPPHILETGIERPAYVITANTLIYQPAFCALDGFCENFTYAAGEDIDLGLRLWKMGMLSYAPEALVYHDFEPDLIAFLKRFIRYGRGNQQLSRTYNIDLTPHRFLPLQESLLYWILAHIQWAGLRIGYGFKRRNS